MREQTLQFWAHFTNLFFPKLCLACNYKAPPRNQDFCLKCLKELPKTTYHFEVENDFTKRFWGRVKLEAGASMYLFAKKSRVKNLIHNLKYQGQKQIGETVGKYYGRQLKSSPLFQEIDLIVPVPLHWKKERMRGYNQSFHFALGLSETMDLPILKDGLIRNVYGDSQTKKSKEERLQNAMNDFEVNRPNELKGKHILLVDDVLTTGATIEGCSTKLLELEGTKVSAVTIAMAVN